MFICLRCRIVANHIVLFRVSNSLWSLTKETLCNDAGCDENVSTVPLLKGLLYLK